MLSDIEIAQAAKMQPITEIAANLGLQGEDVIPYGHYKAKLNHKLAKADKPEGKLILVTAISPTPAGEGKTTTSVGLADAMNALGKKTMLCLREPSLGPVFGIKGGAAGGGYAQVVPMEDINLHFTGDIHAIGAANNLLAAMIDNSIQQGNPLNIDPRRITWKRCMDMNDRQLRFIVDGLGGKVNGTPREDGFDITVASEVMAVFCLATDLDDLKAPSVPHRLRLHLRRPARHRRADRRGGRDDRPFEGCARPEPCPDAGAQPRHHPRRSVRQHCPRLQQCHCHQAEPQAGRLRCDRGRLRRGSGRGEVPWTSSAAMPGCTPPPLCWWPRCARSSPTAAWPSPIWASPTPGPCARAA